MVTVLVDTLERVVKEGLKEGKGKIRKTRLRDWFVSCRPTCLLIYLLDGLDRAVKKGTAIL